MDNNLERIWQYIDGEMTPDQMRRFETDVTLDPGLKAMFDKTLKIHTSLGQMPVDKPSPDFALRVLQNLSARKSFDTSKTFKGVWKILVLFGLTMVVLMLSTLTGPAEGGPGIERISALSGDMINALLSVQSLGLMTLVIFALTGFTWLDVFLKDRLMQKHLIRS